MEIQKISFVIPCYGSEHTIDTVVEEIKVTMEQRQDLDFEILAVNDQSPDGVQAVLEKLAVCPSRFRGQ